MKCYRMQILVAKKSSIPCVIARIHAKIGLHVIKAWNLVQMKLLSCRSEIELGAFQKLSPFVCMPIWLL